MSNTIKDSSGNRIIVIDPDGDTIIMLRRLPDDGEDWPDPVPESGVASTYVPSIYIDLDAGLPKIPDEEIFLITCTRFLVSSMYLKNVSRYFRVMFASGFREAIPNPDTGKYNIVAGPFHRKAMEHVLNILHVKTQRLPKAVDMNILAHILALADYYDIEDAVGFHVETWAKAAMRKKCPTTYGKDMVSRFFVAWSCGDEKNFRRCAELIARANTGHIPHLGFPLLNVTDMLEKARRDAIQALLKKFHEVLQGMYKEDWICSAACLTRLTRTVHVKFPRLVILSSKPSNIENSTHPFSFDDICAQLESCVEGIKPKSSPEGYEEDLGFICGCTLHPFVTTVTEAGEKALKKSLERSSEPLDV